MLSRLLLSTVVVVMCGGVLQASEVRVVITKQPIPDAARLLYVAFNDQPLRVALSMTISGLPIQKLPEKESAALSALPGDDWWRIVTLTLVDRRTDLPVRFTHALEPKSSRRIERGKDGANATQIPYVEYQATLLLTGVSPGDYKMLARIGSMEGWDAVAVRDGTESAAIRGAFLESKARQAKTYAEYRRIQLERAALIPDNAGVFIDLAARARNEGTLEETQQYYDRAIEIVERNISNKVAEHPRAAAELRKSGDATIRYLQGAQRLLPLFFASRDTLRFDQREVDGTVEYVLRDRKTGRIVKSASDR